MVRCPECSCWMVVGERHDCWHVSEAEWTRWVVDLAELYGWRVMHQRPAMTVKGWRTAIQGHAGFPDLVIAHEHRGVMFVELKTNRGQLTDAQKQWQRALGDLWRCWRPRDRDDVQAVLSVENTAGRVR